MGNYFIIGGSGGIGLAVASQLAQSGNQVFATFHKNKPSESFTDIEFYQLNVLEEISSLDFLPDELSGLVYCPGSINLRPFERIRPADFEADYKLQVVGAVRIIQMVLARLKRTSDASIVLFSTVAVQTGLSFHSVVALEFR